MEAGACGNNRQKWANPPQEFQTPCVARHPEQSRTIVISVQTALFADFGAPSDQLPTSPFVGTNPEAFGTGLPDSVTIEPKARTQGLTFRGKQLI